jgi:predicted  nucleic acid-binding Zn-ribbon protein
VGDDDGEGSTKHLAKLASRDTFSRARLEYERIAEQLSKTLDERDQHIARLTDQLAQKSALLEQAEANASEEKKRAGLELRELKAKLDESLLSRDHAIEQIRSALQKASCAPEVNE